jgi:N-acetylglucosaminyldiphosphoundecaprenol N-acetyl-beta-D-mannosaminyltransferase
MYVITESDIGEDDRRSVTEEPTRPARCVWEHGDGSSSGRLRAVHPSPPSPGGSKSPRVEVGPFLVDDLSTGDAIARIVDLAMSHARHQPVLAYALHVGGLNHRSDADFVAAMRRATIVYADGGSVVLLARLAGGKFVERAPTTDIGWSVLRQLTEKLGRPPRIALIGGADGLAVRAGRVLEAGQVASVVLALDGYEQEWLPVLATLVRSEPDVVLIGLGAPLEMKWIDAHRSALPPALVLSCGGWFGHLTGDEARAPALLRRSGLEWMARLAQAPRRLAPRYARGVWTTASLAMPLLLRRRTPDTGDGG